ncbi:MAG: inositol monophosphatase, partial [Lentisphaerae bacterium]|nr:inositol monophosphatase [Lentisphaerota bacterium]
TGLYRSDGNIEASLKLLKVLAGSVRKIRMLGAAALDICFLAHGRIDVYYEDGIYLWDVAAAGLIAERAGAGTRLIDLNEKHRVKFLAANRHIFDDLNNIVIEHDT